MNQETFEKIYQDELTPKQKKVLPLFLAGQTDEQIIKEMGATHRSTASHQLRNISTKFGFTPEIEPDYRCNLIELFAKYKLKHPRQEFVDLLYLLLERLDQIEALSEALLNFTEISDARELVEPSLRQIALIVRARSPALQLLNLPLAAPNACNSRWWRSG